MSELIRQQTGSTTAPRPEGFDEVTGTFNPLLRTPDRLQHMDDGVYDLSPESVLVRLIGAILGDGGLGGVQRSIQLRRLQEQISTTSFTDLDRFFGGLLGINRRQSELLDINPHVDLATLAKWDDIQLKDASYRSRAMQMAQGYQTGPTVDGVRQVARAITGQEVDVIEGWVDGFEPTVSWGDLEGLLWGDLGPTWGDLAWGDGRGEVEPQRNEIVLVVPRELTPGEGLDLRRAVERIAPINSVIRVVSETVGEDITIPFTPFSRSERWEVRSRHENAVVEGKKIFSATEDEGVFLLPPVPPWTRRQGDAWSHMTLNPRLVAYATENDPSATDIIDPMARDLPIQTAKIDGEVISYPVEFASSVVGDINAGRSVSDGVQVVNPYADRYESSDSSEIWIDGVPTKSVGTTRPPSHVLFWVSPIRVPTAPDSEIVEIRFDSAVAANHISWSVCKFPHSSQLQYWDENDGQWVTVFSNSFSGSNPLGIGNIVPQDAPHPLHFGDSHWMKESVHTDLILARKWRIVLKRIDGVGPLGLNGSRIPYSLALKNVDVGVRIRSVTDFPPTQRGEIISSTMTISDIRSVKELFVAGAQNVADDAPSAWISEPQPTSDSIVSLYLRPDTPSVVNRIYIDPAYSGMVANVYAARTLDRSGVSNALALERPLLAYLRGGVAARSSHLEFGAGTACISSEVVGEGWHVAIEIVGQQSSADELRTVFAGSVNGGDVVIYLHGTEIGALRSVTGSDPVWSSVDMGQPLPDGHRVRLLLTASGMVVSTATEELVATPQTLTSLSFADTSLPWTDPSDPPWTRTTHDVFFRPEPPVGGLLQNYGTSTVLDGDVDWFTYITGPLFWKTRDGWVDVNDGVYSRSFGAEGVSVRAGIRLPDALVSGVSVMAPPSSPSERVEGLEIDVAGHVVYSWTDGGTVRSASSADSLLSYVDLGDSVEVMVSVGHLATTVVDFWWRIPDGVWSRIGAQVDTGLVDIYPLIDITPSLRLMDGGDNGWGLFCIELIRGWDASASVLTTDDFTHERQLSVIPINFATILANRSIYANTGQELSTFYSSQTRIVSPQSQCLAPSTQAGGIVNTRVTTGITHTVWDGTSSFLAGVRIARDPSIYPSDRILEIADPSGVGRIMVVTSAGDGDPYLSVRDINGVYHTSTGGTVAPRTWASIFVTAQTSNNNTKTTVTLWAFDDDGVLLFSKTEVLDSVFPAMKEMNFSTNLHAYLGGMVATSGDVAQSFIDDPEVRAAFVEQLKLSVGPPPGVEWTYDGTSPVAVNGAIYLPGDRAISVVPYLSPEVSQWERLKQDQWCFGDINGADFGLAHLNIGTGDATGFLTDPEGWSKINAQNRELLRGSVVRYHPSYSGWSEGDIVSVGFMGGTPDVWADMRWAPLGQYPVESGFIDIPDFLCAAIKIDFTSLVAEPWETFIKVSVDSTRPGGVAPSQGMSISALELAAERASSTKMFQDIPSVSSTPVPLTVSPSAGLVANDPGRWGEFAQRSGYGFSVQGWQQSSLAPMVDREGVHSGVLQNVLVESVTRTSWFAGVREIKLMRRVSRRRSNSALYFDPLLGVEDLDLDQTTMFVEPGQAYTTESDASGGMLVIPQVLTTLPHLSYSQVRGVQVASQQSPPIQLIPDDEFRSPALRHSAFDSENGWHPTGSAVLSWDLEHSTVRVDRDPTILDLLYTPDTPIVHPPVTPIVTAGEDGNVFTIVDDGGGISSPYVTLTPSGQAYAATRVSVDSELHDDLWLRVYDASDNVLAEVSFRPKVGALVEKVLRIDTITLPEDGGIVRVVVEQDHGHVDAWTMHALSLFDPSIRWEASVDDGGSWIPITSIVNLVDGAAYFSDPGRALRVRATCYRVNLIIDAIQIRPWYQERIGAPL